MVDREHGARREEHRQTVLRLLGAAGIRIADLEVAPREVSASVAVLTAYLGERAKGNVRVMRRSPGGEGDLWHANQGDRECLAEAALIEITLRGLGYETRRGSAVPNQVDFLCPATSEAPALAE